MPVTLAQAALNTQDDLDANIIDEFRKSSALLDALLFHDTVNPMGGGSTLTYGYHRTLALRSAAFRAINTEYTPEEATKQRFSVDLKPLGGSFQIDRVLAGVARGAEVTFQLQQLVSATTQKFADEVINGDTNVNSNGFDGLDKALRGTSTEINADTVSDWSDLDTYGFQKALDLVDTFLGVMDGAPTLLMGNSRLIAKIWAIARRANSNIERPTDGLLGANGRPLTRRFYGENTLLIDLGDKPGTSNPIIPTESRDPDNTIYVVTVTGSPTGGTYTLTVTTPDGAQTTAAIAYNATAAAVQDAIIALSNVPTGGVTVTGSAGGPYTVTFTGDLTDQVVTVALGTNSLTGGTTPSVTTVESATTTNYTSLTDLYAVRVGMDGFHGVATNGPILETWLPDFARAGAVKTGEVEMGPLAVVLKATKAAAVLRNLKVA